MTKQEFYNKVAEGLKEKLGQEVTIELQEVKKVNVSLDGVVIRQKGCNICPTIYLNPYFTEFNEGVSMDNIIHEILEVYEKNQPDSIRNIFRTEDFFDFDKMRDKIVLKVINAEKNEDLLSHVPHLIMDGLGLAVVFYVELGTDARGNAGILIKNEHLDLWQADVSQLLSVAEQNTNRMHSYTIRKMTEILKQSFAENGIDISDEELEMLETEAPVMYVLTDQHRTFGASQLYLKDAIKQFAEKADTDVYILPSSVHELLLIRADFPSLEPEYLKEMVCEVNAVEVSEADFLFDGAFKYVLSENKIIAL